MPLPSAPVLSPLPDPLPPLEAFEALIKAVQGNTEEHRQRWALLTDQLQKAASNYPLLVAMAVDLFDTLITCSKDAATAVAPVLVILIPHVGYKLTNLLVRAVSARRADLVELLGHHAQCKFLIDVDVAEQLLPLTQSEEMVTLLRAHNFIDSCRLEFDYIVALLNRRPFTKKTQNSDNRDLMWRLFPAIDHLSLEQLARIVGTAVTAGNPKHFCAKLMDWIDTSKQHTSEHIWGYIQEHRAEPCFSQKIDAIKRMMDGPRRRTTYWAQHGTLVGDD